MNNFTVLSFYNFINLTNVAELQARLLYLGKRKTIKGTILLGQEGFNGSICGDQQATEYLLSELIKLTGAKADTVNVKTNYWSTQVFKRFKVKIKPEIITLGIKDFNIVGLTGEYITPEQWEAVTNTSDTVLIDVRNDYEVEVGTFAGAINPQINCFRAFPEWVKDNQDLLKDKKIAMFCTGGIRCEKSTAYLKSLGYKKVYHLEGGILNYLEKTKNHNEYWQGKCFVFDERIAVAEDLGTPDLS